MTHQPGVYMPLRALILVYLRILFTLEKHENHSKYPKNTEKNLKCLKNILGRPQKSRVGRVSGNDTFFFFWPHQLPGWNSALVYCWRPVDQMAEVGERDCYGMYSFGGTVHHGNEPRGP